MKKISKIMSIFLAILIFVVESSINVYASSFEGVSTYESDALPETNIYSTDNFRITYEYNKQDGKSIVRGYENNVLVEEDYIYDNDSKNIHINNCIKNGLNKSAAVVYGNNFSVIEKNNTSKVIPIDSIIQMNGNPGNSGLIMMYKSSAYSRYLGKLNVSLKRTSQKFNISVTEVIGSPYQTTYTINNYVGSLVTLAAAIIGAFNVPGVIASLFASGFLASVCYSLGISVVGNTITKALSTTVSANISDVYLQLGGFSNKRIRSGKKVVVNDSRSKYKGNTYYDGVTGRDWKTSRLASMIISSVFGRNYVNDYAYTFK